MRNNPFYDAAGSLWPSDDQRQFFADIDITHQQQVGGTCVSTGLSQITGEAPMDIRAQINTQAPTSWSLYLQQHGMKLAYCNSDFRRLKFYVDELLALDDLFTISTYSPTDPEAIGCDPDASGWVCGSHFFLLYRDTIYDTAQSKPILLEDYYGLDRYVKRIFRVVPCQASECVMAV